MIEDDPLGVLLDLAAPRRDDLCLDYGTGVGRAAFSVAPFVRRVVGVDNDEEILSEAARLGREVGAGAVEFRRVDLDDVVPYDSSTFDLIVSAAILHRLLEPVRSLREMKRVLRPGGRIAVLEVVVDEDTDRYVNELARLREPDHWRHYRTEEYERMFRDAGLQVKDRRVVRQSVDLDAWAEAGLTARTGLDLISGKLRSYPVPAQVALDAAYTDGRASFSFDVMAARLEA